MVTSTAALLTAWEAGATEAPFYRSASLLRSFDVVPADSSLEQMTVGQCDARLYHLRRLLFGEQLDLVATCPACGGDVELSLAVIELQPASTSDPVSSIDVKKDGFRLSCRVPVNADLSALAALGDRATPGDLLERCLLEASSPDSDDVAVSELPEPLVEAALEAIAEN
ncbi:MAG: T4 family baseplate hub assembly chaperone, partial [Ilumatobacteraceae bacterium]